MAPFKMFPCNTSTCATPAVDTVILTLLPHVWFGLVLQYHLRDKITWSTRSSSIRLQTGKWWEGPGWVLDLETTFVFSLRTFEREAENHKCSGGEKWQVFSRQGPGAEEGQPGLITLCRAATCGCGARHLWSEVRSSAFLIVKEPTVLHLRDNTPVF